MTAPDWATHKGWFGFCPVWVAFEGEGVHMEARHWLLEYALDASEWCVGAAIFCYSWLNPKWEPMFPIRLTGEIRRP